MRQFRSYAQTQFPQNRFIVQDALISDTMKAEANHSRELQNAASIESAANARMGLALSNYLNFLTGFPEYLR